MKKQTRAIKRTVKIPANTFTFFLEKVIFLVFPLWWGTTIKEKNLLAIFLLPKYHI